MEIFGRIDRGPKNLLHMEQLEKKLVIFDFDGTIVRTGEIVAKVINELASEYGYKTLDPSRAEEYRSKGALEFAREDLKISLFRLPRFGRRLRDEVTKRIAQVVPESGLPEVLGELKNRGYKLGIVSSNSKQNIEYVLRHYNIAVDFVVAGSFSKRHAIRDALVTAGANTADAVYIGDEIRDIDMAQKVGIDIIPVSWGFNNERAFEKAGASYIRKPEQLLEILPPRT